MNICVICGQHYQVEHYCNYGAPQLQPVVNFDLERMKQALAAPVKVMPRGLSRKEKMRFLGGED